MEHTYYNYLNNVISIYWWETKHHTIKSVKKIYNTIIFGLKREQPLIATWCTIVEGENWGDALNPVLIELITKKKPVSSDEIISFKKMDEYCVIGSILGRYTNRNSVIWGAGFISADRKLKVKPRKICAVRGPLSRDLLIKQGIYCPEVYGDPALLYPLFYKPEAKKEYKLGIIPHYVDKKNPLLENYKKYPEVLIIDILGQTNDVIENISKCERIASSSLHGIIASDAYGIPSIWIEFSEKVIGNGFKFYDYFESVGRNGEKPLLITPDITLRDIYYCFHEYKINIDLIKLLEACPLPKTFDLEEMKKRICTASQLKSEEYDR